MEQTLIPFSDVPGDESEDWLIGGTTARMRLAEPVAANEDDNVFSGNDNPEVLDGTENSDTIFGGGGNDLISGLGSDDLLHGDDGDDVLFGGSGNDVLTGGDGADSFSGGVGLDTVHYADNGLNGVVIDLSANGGLGSWQDAFGNADAVALATIEAYRGTSAADTMIGDAAGGTNPLTTADFFGEGGDDLLIGSGLGELLDGGSGNDSLSGLGGDDTLIGGEGFDTIDGGEGIDTISYVNASRGFSLELFEGASGSGQFDTVTNVEIVLGSAFADFLSADGETLFGGGGNDFVNSVEGLSDIFGDDGEDILAALGSDVTSQAIYDGGADRDTLAVGGSGVFDLTGATLLNLEAFAFGTADPDGVRLLASQAGFSDGYGWFVDAVGVVEILMAELELLDLSATPITEEADATAGFVILGDGDSETILGTSVADTINGDAGNDIIAGGVGNDVLDGGEGLDTLTYASSDAGIGLNLQAGLGTAGGALGDVVSGFERVIGTEFADSLVLGSDPQTIEAGGGADLIIGGDGADLLYGGAGNDMMSVDAPDIANDLGYFGGTGVSDKLSIAPGGAASIDLSGHVINGIEELEISASMTTFGVTLSVAQMHALSAITNGAHDGFTRRFDVVLEDADALDLSNLVLTGFDEPGDGFNVTGDGDGETITGSAVAETITAGAGDDRVVGSEGADALFGGADTDILDYSGSSAAVSVNLVIQTASGLGGEAAGDQISGFEHVIGSAFADELIASGGQILEGGAGEDSLRVDAGSVEAFGGEGEDLLVVRSNAVQSSALLDGGAGTDRLLIFDFIAGTQDLRDDTLTDVEVLAFQTDPIELGVQLTASQASQLEAVEAEGTHARTISVDLADGDTLDLSGLEVLGLDQDGSAFVINGGEGSETIIASELSDLVDAGLGDDSLDGGEGEDTLSFSTLAAPSITIGDADFGVFVDLSAQGVAQATGAGTDTFEGFEHAEGSGFADILTGDEDDNLLMGGAGGDFLQGGAGNDMLEGGTGFDVVEGGAGADQLFGGTDGGGIEGDVAAYFSSSGPLVFDFGASIMEIEDGSSEDIRDDVIGDDIEGVAGSAAFGNTFLAEEVSDLTLFLGGSEADTFFGGSGTDQLVGLGGNDVMYGNDGSDAFLGEGGNDDLFGGAGSDAFFFDGTDGFDTIHDLELGADLIFFTGGNAAVEDLTITDTDAGGTAATDALISYEVGGVASSITVIDFDADTVSTQATILFS